VATRGARRRDKRRERQVKRRPCPGVEIQARHITDLGLQLRVGGELETLRPPGLQPHSRHTLATLALDRPSSAASSRGDQCVTPGRSGGGSSVASTTATSSTVRGLPGLGRSASPPAPSAAYRRFHAITVVCSAPFAGQFHWCPARPAASSTILARCASSSLIDGGRTHEASTSRSHGGTPRSLATGQLPTPEARFTGREAERVQAAWNGSWNEEPRNSSGISACSAHRRAVCAGSGWAAYSRASRNA
jgi:hypothetical protein